ncbi:MAG: acyl-CoA mutase large subunit family protein [Bacteroidetes bacterium]|nr:acyl-CoA mutase large subunit family protein [Bacteroidota bacterium]
MDTDTSRLFNEFPPVSTQTWEEVIRQDLKGADYEKKLVWKTPEGFPVQPYYRAEDLAGIRYLDVAPGKFPFVRGGANEGNKWKIRQEIHVQNISAANEQAQEALQRGADEVSYVADSEVVSSQTEFEKLMRGIDPEQNAIHFISGGSSPDLISMLANYVSKGGFQPDLIQGSIDFDPLRYLSLHGNYYYGEEERAFERAKRIVTFAREHLPSFRPLAVNGYIFREAGGTIVQELAFGLSMAVEYLSRLTDRSIPADIAAQALHFNVGTGSSYFMEIAKLRAARFLWARIVETYCPDNDKSCRISIHSRTIKWNKTLYDPNVNMLRATTEAMSAILGGTDSLTVLPFNGLTTENDHFGMRVARNVQLILRDEVYLNKVTDPAAGSYYVENLTDALIQEAWKLFLEVEAKGGYVKAFRENFIQDIIEETANKRMSDISQRREIILGTNQYPNFREKASDNICISELFAEHDEEKILIGRPVRMFRGSMEFEKLRLATDRSGKRPLVFMLTFGSLAMRRARSQFSSNFFACAGYEVKDNNGFTSVEEGVDAAIAARADIVVICSSDEEYPAIAPAIYDGLKDRSVVVVAGYPQDCIEELKSHGLQHFIHVKTNVLQTLHHFHEILGIENIN